MPQENTQNNRFYRFLRSGKTRTAAGLSFGTLVITALATSNVGSLLFASLVGIPFDGTVWPIKEVPRYEMLAKLGLNSETHYSEIPSAALRTYTGPGDPNNEVLPGGGYYTSKGSHPGVDIRAARGTPVYAMANGIVYETKTSSSWGKIVIIKHSDTPLGTIYSNYAHLDKITTSANQVVRKGEKIGEVGMTGIASGYHLDWSINKENVPYAGWWPFTSTEMAAAGYNFVEAVDNCLGCENLSNYTHNPLQFVNLYDNYQTSVQVVTIQNNPDTGAVIEEKTTVKDNTETKDNPSSEAAEETNGGQRLSRAERIAQRRQEAIARAQQIAAGLAAQEEKEIEYAYDRPKPMPRPAADAKDPIRATDILVNTETDLTNNNYSEGKEIASIEIIHDGYFECSTVSIICRREKVKVTLKDADGKPALNPSSKFDLFIRDTFGQANISGGKMSEKDFQHSPTVSFSVTPTSSTSIILEAIFVGETKRLRELSSPLVIDRSPVLGLK